MSDIATELTDSMSRSGKGAMTAPLELANGSVTTPALSFDSDTDSGLYRAGADNPAVSAGGTQAQAWTATGTTVPGTLAVTGASTLTGATTVTGALTATAGIVSGGTAYSTPVVDSTGALGTDDRRLMLRGLTSASTYARVYNSSFGTLDITSNVSWNEAGPAWRSDASSAASAYAFGVDGLDLYREPSPTGGADFASFTDRLSIHPVEPSSTTAYTNTLTMTNIPKAWGTLDSDGAGNISVSAGFNIASVSLSSGNAVVTLTTAGQMSGTNYAVMATSGSLALSGGPKLLTTAVVSSSTQFTIYLWDTSGSGTQESMATEARTVYFVVFGAQ